jgi:outer membrane receptor for ferrienterochelin and colicin
MRSFNLRVLFFSLMAALAFAAPASAQQGTTTGTFRGRVTTAEGQPVVGAQVVARNIATGGTRGALTDAEGRYAIPLLQPGPYTLRVTSIGYAEVERTGINASAGVVSTIDFTAAVQAVAVEGVTAVGTRADLGQTGVATRVGTEQVENLPVAGRDFTDFLNLSPLVSPQPGIGTGGQFSIAGQRTSGTNVQIDGTDANNIYFGENRGSSRTPFAFSLESIREFQLITNGYDVEYGSYQGGVVNAVTKGGGNNWSGTGFYYRRGEGLTSNDFLGAPPRDYQVNQFGASLSGPVMQDKLHFFLSADVQRKEQPIFATVPVLGTSAVTQDSLNRVIAALETRYGLENAARYFGTFPQEENNTVLFGRVDWTINPDHRLTLRQNYSNFVQTNDRLSATEAITNSGDFKDKTWSTVGELNSVFSDNMFNTFRFQWSYEDRPRPGNDLDGYLPQITINNVGASGVFFGGDGVLFRNRLEETKLQFIDNFNYRMGSHSLKLGGNVLMGSNLNLFWNGGQGTYTFNSLRDFELGIPNRYNRNLRACLAPLTANAAGQNVICPQYDEPVADFEYTEYSVYAQDDMQLTNRLLITAGLRFQGTTFPDDPGEFAMVRDTFGYSTNVLPKFAGWSPRLSFSYDFGERERVLRGGVALLVGRAPTVLAGNVISTQRTILSLSCTTPASIPTLTAATLQEMRAAGQGLSNPAACVTGAALTGRPEFALFDEDFELPQTWKGSIGYEHLFGTGTRFSIDGIHSRAYQQFTVKDLNLGARACQPSQTAGSFVGRDPQAITPCFTLTGEFNRPVFVPVAQYNPRNAAAAGATANNRNTVNAMDRVYYNVSDGEAESWNINVELNQQLLSDRLRIGAAYAWVRAYDNSSFSCCTSNEGWGSELTAGNPNVVGDIGDEEALWGPSRFERRHTFTANFMWRAPIGIRMSGIWRSQSGLPFTPVVNGDVNADGQSFNDRAPISRNLLLINAAEMDTLNMLINEWDCLEDQLESIAKRNSCRGPWWHSLDLRLSKEISTWRGQRAELLVDFFNVLNGLNSDWGRYMGVFAAQTNLLRPAATGVFDAPTGRVRYEVNYTAARPADNVPESGFGVAQPTGFDPFQFQAQLGIRYRF